MKLSFSCLLTLWKTAFVFSYYNVNLCTWSVQNTFFCAVQSGFLMIFENISFIYLGSNCKSAVQELVCRRPSPSVVIYDLYVQVEHVGRVLIGK